MALGKTLARQLGDGSGLDPDKVAARWGIFLTAFLLKGSWGVFSGFLLEGFGLPIPMELLYTLVGRLVNLGRLTYPEAVALAFAGTLVGNVIGYHIGRYGGRAAINYLAETLDISGETLSRFEGWFRRHGLSALFVVRWTGLGYAQLTWFCGLAGISLWRFILVAAIADLLWATVWTYAGHQLTRYLHFLFRPEILLPAGGILAAAILYTSYRLYQRWRKERSQGKPPQDNQDDLKQRGTL